MTASFGTKRREPVVQRIRGRRLQRIRAEVLMANPLCVACQEEGRVREATEVDHIIPLSKGGRDEPANRQGLCADHHQAKTARDMGYKRRIAVDINGYPITYR